MKGSTLSTSNPVSSSSSLAGSSGSTDDFASIRSQWITVLTGVTSSLDTSGAVYSAAISSLNSSTASYLSLLDTASGATQLFTDLPLGSDSANVTASLDRLETLAMAYLTPGTNYTGQDSIAETVVSGLDFMCAGAYAPDVRPYGNWWDWQIGGSQRLVDTATMVYPALSASQIANYCASVDTFVPDPTESLIVSAGTYYTSTGANRIDECRAVIIRGALAGDAAKVTQGVCGISATLPFVTTGDGLYSDGGWIQHSYIPYTGAYGAIWFGDLIKLMGALAGTSYQITDPDVSNIFFAATSGFAPVVYNGLMTDAVRGRAIARSHETDYDDGFAAACNFLMLAPAAPTPELELELKSKAKGWLLRTPYQISSVTSVVGVAYSEQVLNDSSIPAAPEPAGHTLFASMDRAYHRRPGWAVVVSLSSGNIAYYETGGGSNLYGWQAGSGMTYQYLDSDNTQYNDAFWPTVDPYRLPGITASLIPLAPGEGGAYGEPRPANAWAGGTTDGEYAAIGQDLRGPWSTLVAKKSWFCLDDAIVCLGAGISAADGYEVDSVIDNRNLGADGTSTLIVNGVPQPSARGWAETFTRARWAVLEGQAGYVFPEGLELTALREQRTGEWATINEGDSTTPYTRDYVTLYANHGVNPAGAGYAYILMPGARAWQVRARAADQGWFRTLANTAQQQGIAVPSLGVTAVNFFTAGTAGPLTASATASILIREHPDGTATISVSDPTRQDAGLDITWDRPVRSVISRPGTLTAARTGSTLQLSFGDLTGAAGETQEITVSLG
jgi:hyaluronate lyase